MKPTITVITCNVCVDGITYTENNLSEKQIINNAKKTFENLKNNGTGAGDLKNILLLIQTFEQRRKK